MFEDCLFKKNMLIAPLSALQGYHSSSRCNVKAFQPCLSENSDMAMLSPGQKAQKRLVENITLLWTLCEVPGQAKENRVRGGHDKGRQLPCERERQLVDSFAFISATTDDPLRVMAVCIEEDSDKTGMTIRLASNTGDLSLVTQGFDGIARTLEQASLRSRARHA